MDLKRLFACVLLGFLCGGCEKEQVDLDQPVGAIERPGTLDGGSADMGSDAATTRNLKEFGQFAGVPLMGVPMEEDPGALRIAFKGEPGEFPLYRNFGNTHRVSSRFIAEEGQKITFNESYVFINKPRILTITEDVKVPGTEYDTARQLTGDKVEIEYKKGEVVELLKTAGEGMCFVGYGRVVYHTQCPTELEFEGENWSGETTPLETEWWVQASVQAARGWLIVDGKDFQHEIDEKAKRRLKKKRKRR